MFASLTPAQKLVVALAVIALVAGLWIGAGSEEREPVANATDEEMYALPDSPEVPITVHVVGAVRSPGLYTLPAGSRVRDVIELAGGLTERARVESVNLAAYLDDGEQVSVEAEPLPEPEPPAVPPAPDAAAPEATPPATPPPSVASQPTATSPPQAPASPQNELPSWARRPTSEQPRLNSGGLEELQRIRGIGPELAKRIISYRSVHGPFRRYEDLDDVPGIGPATIDEIRVSASLR